MLFFPNGEPLLQFVHDILAGGKGYLAVNRDHPHPDSHFPDLQVAAAMKTAGVQYSELFPGLFQNGSALFFRQSGVSLILQAGNRLAFIEFPHPS